MVRVLVVDDDPSAVRGMTRLLSDDGYDVSAFTGGAAAIEALARDGFDVVMTDLEMPGIDGHAVVRATRHRHPLACLVVITGRAEMVVEDLARAGVCIVSDKPFEFSSVVRAVSECRSRGGPGAPGSCHMRSMPPDQQLFDLRRR
jgi:two-component system response regulator FlrC